MAKAMIIKCTIGTLDISNDSIDDLKIDRNFSDVSNKFSMSLIDSPAVNSLFTDIELYMCSGGRSISIRFGDDINNLESFNGTIWDYRATFVGDIKKLEISGYVTPAEYLQNVSGSTYSYNIDWNSYYNLRADNTKMWNVLRQLDRSNGLANKYNEFKDKTEDKDLDSQIVNGMFVTYGSYEGAAVGAEQTSDILDDFFHSLYTFNTTYVPVKGAVGTIKLPVPTSFVSSTGTSVIGKDSDSGTVVDFDQQAVYRFYGAKDVIYKYYSYKDHKWHEVDKDKTVSGNRVYYIFPKNDKNHIVGFKSQEGTYIEVALDKKWAGSGIMLYNSNGVSPSDIVRQLAILEGWEIGNIVDTDTVPCGDNFKMNNQSALEFITNNLIPVSILPIGLVSKSDGSTVRITSGVGGFHPYFKNGKFYYEPLDTGYFNDITSSILLGYNIPNSPVLSFQVDSKGTVFYTVQNIKINATSLTSGKEIEEVAVTSEAQIKEYNKVSGFNEGLASFFGYSYNEALSSGFKIDMAGKSTTDTLTGDTNPYRTDDEPFTLKSPQLLLNSTLYDDKLVSSLAISAATSETEIRGRLEQAKRNIQDIMVKATMTLWGDIRLKPASLIKVVNMIKSSDAIYPVQHFSSGVYMIQSQTDEISKSGYIQTLNLLKYTNDFKNSLSELSSVDWSSSKILPLTSNLNFKEDSNVIDNKLPKGYGLVPGVKYKGHLVYSNGSNKVYVPDLGEYINLNDLVKSSSKQEFFNDVTNVSGSMPTPPKGYSEVYPGIYGKGYSKSKYNLGDVTRFYTPYYGGMYFTWDSDTDSWTKNKNLKPPAVYKEFYVNGSSSKYVIEDFYYNSHYKPNTSTYYWLFGRGTLRRDGS